MARTSFNCLRVLLCLVLLCSPSLADTPILSNAQEGNITLPAGALYVPQNLEWSQHPSEDGIILIGQRKSPPLKVGIAFLTDAHKIETPEAVGLFEKHLVPLLSQEVPAVKLKEAVTAPYPWAETLELRLDNSIPASVYVGSGSGTTLLIAAFGSDGPETANSIAASFKENFNFRLKNRKGDGREEHIQSMLSAASTFLLFVFLFLPMAFVLLQNRRHKKSDNPFKPALFGLAIAFVVALIVDYLLLSRFAWASAANYGQAMGSSLARYLFLSIVCGYFAKRWGQSHESEE